MKTPEHAWRLFGKLKDDVPDWEGPLAKTEPTTQVYARIRNGVLELAYYRNGAWG